MLLYMDRPNLQRQVYVTENDITLGAEVEKDLKQRTFEIRDVPSLKLFDVSVDGISEKIQEIKLSNRSIEFINKIQAVLDLFDKTENKYNEKIVLFAMQAVENLFINKKKVGSLKLKCVIEACSKYFNDDHELITKFVDLMMSQLKTNRLYKLRVYFLRLFGRLV